MNYSNTFQMNEGKAMSFCSKCGQKLAEQEKFCPGCGQAVNLADAPIGALPPIKEKPKSPAISGCLSTIIIIAVIYFIGTCNKQEPTHTDSDNTPTFSTQPSAPAPSAPASTEPKLKKGSENFRFEDGYCIVDGEVTNISSDKISDVEAVTTFYDKAGNVVKTTDALIKYNPITAGQTSPYETMDTENPVIKTEKTTFASIGGEAIPFKDK